MPSLSPTQLARQAFDRAVDALEYKRDVTREISAAEALRQYRELYAAWRQQKDDLEQAAFLERAGIISLNTVTERVCADICASISPDRAA
jgi:acyl-CoA reductase-like NAD-dependent aldehyde dehydrogenase